MANEKLTGMLDELANRKATVTGIWNSVMGILPTILVQTR